MKVYESGRNLEMAERKTEYIFCGGGNAFVLIAVLGVAGITAGRSGIAKSSEVESVRQRQKRTKWRSKSRRTQKRSKKRRRRK